MIHGSLDAGWNFSREAETKVNYKNCTGMNSSGGGSTDSFNLIAAFYNLLK